MVDGKADTVDSIDAGAFIIVLQLELGWFTQKVSTFRIVGCFLQNGGARTHTKYCVTSRLTRKVLFFVRWPNLIKCSFFTVFKYLPPSLHFPLKGKVLCKNKGRAKKSPWSPILTEGGVSLVEH